MILTSVDLPAPLSPSSATTSPRPISKLMPRSASMAPKLLGDRCRAGAAGSVIAVLSPSADEDRRGLAPQRAGGRPRERGEARPRPRGRRRRAAPRPAVARGDMRGAVRSAAPPPSRAGARRRRDSRSSSAAGARPPITIVSGSKRFSIVTMAARKSGAIPASQAASPCLGDAAFDRHRARDSAPGSRDCRRGRASPPARAADGRSRRHCHARRAAPRHHAPSSRRGRRRNRDSRNRGTRRRRHRAARHSAARRRCRRRRRPGDGTCAQPCADGDASFQPSSVVGPTKLIDSTPNGPGIAMPMPSMRPAGRPCASSDDQAADDLEGRGTVRCGASIRRRVTSVPARSISPASRPRGEIETPMP